MILPHLARIAIFFYYLQQLLCTGARTVPLVTAGSRIPNDVLSAPGVRAVPDPAETAGLPVPDSRTVWDHSTMRRPSCGTRPEDPIPQGVLSPPLRTIRQSVPYGGGHREERESERSWASYQGPLYQGPSYRS